MSYWCGFHQVSHKGKGENAKQPSVWHYYEAFCRDRDDLRPETVKVPYTYNDRICAAARQELKNRVKNADFYTIQHGYLKGYRLVFRHVRTTEPESADSDDDEEKDGNSNKDENNDSSDSEKSEGMEVDYSDNGKRESSKKERFKATRLSLPFRPYPGNLNNLKFNHSVKFTLPEDDPFVYSYGGISGHLVEICRLLSGHWVTFNVLDAYLSLIIDKMRNNSPTTVLLPSRFCPIDQKDGPKITPITKEMQHFYRDLKEKIQKSTIMIAPLQNSSHAYLAIFNFRENGVVVYDSAWKYLDHSRWSLRRNQIQSMLKVIDPENEEKWMKNYVEKRNCKEQPDAHSCVIMVALYVKNVLHFGTSKECEEMNKFAGYKTAHMLEMCQDERQDMGEKLLLTHPNGFMVRRLFTK